MSDDKETQYLANPDEQSPFNMKLKVSALIICGLFLIGFALGFLFPVELADDLFSIYDTTIGDIEELTVFETFKGILLNNERAILMPLLLSVFVIPAPFYSFLNGFLVSAVCECSIYYGMSVETIIAGLLPHGIIEIPAILIAFSAALSFGLTLVVNIFRENRFKSYWPLLKHHLLFVLIAVLLIPIAAAIEAYITPIVMELTI